MLADDEKMPHSADPSEFDDYLTRLEKSAASGNGADGKRAGSAAGPQVLANLEEAPVVELATLKQLRQSKLYLVRRYPTPYREGVALRLIVWFPDDKHVVVALFSEDKARMGDVFYDSVGPRAVPRSRRGNDKPRLREVS